MTNAGVIRKQWGKFIAEGILARIPNKVDPAVYAVYADDASDRNGDYTFVIGARVSETSAIPAGMVASRVPAGKYSVVTSARSSPERRAAGVAADLELRR